MSTVEELYLGVINAGISAHPRSLQKRIGPSEIGRPCDRWLLHKLNGDGEPDRGPAWKPAIGTAVHAQLEEWFTAANYGGGETQHVEWVTEWEVTVGTIGGTPITGHSDLFHVPTGTVIDHKVIGPKQLAKYRLHGPSEQYRVQAHLYAAGFTADGGWGPARTVAIAFLPRDGELSQAVFWHEPADPHLAAAAMARANRLHTMLTVVGLDQALAACPLCDDPWCTWCRAEKRVQARAAGASLFSDFDAPILSAPAPVVPLFVAPPAVARWGEPTGARPMNRTEYEASRAKEKVALKAKKREIAEQKATAKAERKALAKREEAAAAEERDNLELKRLQDLMTSVPGASSAHRGTKSVHQVPAPGAVHRGVPDAGPRTTDGKRHPVRASVAVTCAVCATPLHPSTVAEGYTTHPSCDGPQTPAQPVLSSVPATPLPAAVAPVINLFNR